MSYAVLFSGQGTQHPGMLPWLEAEPACQSALAALQSAGGADWRGALADDSQRSSNAFAQPLIVCTGLAAWSALAAHLTEGPTAVAGYSVGELSAYACAGVFSHEVAITLARQRAACMDAAVQGLETGLLSVSGWPMEAVLQTCPGLDCAIHIGADQGIYAGTTALLDASATTLTGQGALCKRLDVRVASHSHWMARAAEQFAGQLRDLPFARPSAPLACNATGTTGRQPDALRQALSDQIARTVRWAACMESIAEQGVACVIEVGAGTALSKMWNQQHPTIPARSIEEFRDAAGAARWIARM